MLFELSAYSLAGVFSTAIYFWVAYGLEGRTSVSWAIFWAFWISLPVSYLAQRWLVFGFDRSVGETALKFFMVQAGTLALNLWIAHILSGQIAFAKGHWPRRFIIAAAYMASAFVAYLAMKFWVF